MGSVIAIVLASTTSMVTSGGSLAIGFLPMSLPSGVRTALPPSSASVFTLNMTLFTMTSLPFSCAKDTHHQLPLSSFS